MSTFQAIILGIIQGFTEFLPVSSSGHLILAQKVMGITAAQPLVFEIIVHVGTLFAVLVVFRRDIWQMICHPLQKPMIYLVIATIPAVVFTLLFNDIIESAFGGNYLGFAFIITGILLTIAERKKVHHPRKFSRMKATDALAMGGMQALAMFPGISRSGSTLVGGLFSGLNRTLATRFAFLMSIPAILGSLVFKLKDLLEAGSTGMGWLPLSVSAIVAAVSGFFAIKGMLYLIQNNKLYGFAVYVCILGALVLFDQFVTNIFFYPIW